MKVPVVGIGVLLLFCGWLLFSGSYSKESLEAANTPPPPKVFSWHEEAVITVVKKVEKLPGFEGVGWTIVQVGEDASSRFSAQVSPFRDIPPKARVKVRQVTWEGNQRNKLFVLHETLFVQ